MERAAAKPQVHVFPTAADVAQAAAEAVAQLARAVASRCGRFTLALSGGETPRLLYRALAENHRDAIAWDRLHCFWGDDRFVPADDPSSNLRMAREALLDQVAVPRINVHPMPVFFHDPAAAAADYEATLRCYWRTPWPRFDLILLGLGADGHTASLFPGSPALAEPQRWVAAVHEPTVTPAQRLTLTLPVLNQAAHVYFLATGEAKADTVARVLSGAAGVTEAPAAGVRPAQGELVWWLDEAAAARVK